MMNRHPLRQILEQGRPHWDRNEVAQAVRRALGMAVQCRTAALGAEVYASEKQERIVYHTCKSRACASCGHRGTIQWQRERWVILPDVPYKGITFTMPQEFWSLFQQNRALANALPALAAGILESCIKAKHGLRVGAIAILHTFNGRLEFNSHVHTMVTAGGLRVSTGEWVRSIFWDQGQLTRLWRNAVIDLIRSAHTAGRLRTEMTFQQLEAVLTYWAARWWSVKVQTFKSREHFLRYAGRYVRRPPIAQRRITRIEKGTVTFWAKDKKLRRLVEVQLSVDEFVDSWIQHIPARYKHSMRYFGLFAPRAVSQKMAAIFVAIGQVRRPRPKPLSWANSIKRDFGWDPLIDETGNRMHWVRRLPPVGTQGKACCLTEMRTRDETQC
jgi:putative transposase/transposase-like zinc-binding protein